jgi:hypothetical protein
MWKTMENALTVDTVDYYTAHEVRVGFVESGVMTKGIK